MPEQGEVGEQFVIENLLEVELEVGLAGERVVVAQQAQDEAIRDDAPEVLVGVVEQLLHEAVRAGAGGAGEAAAAGVEVDAAADEVDRHGAPLVGDGGGFRPATSRAGARWRRP